MTPARTPALLSAALQATSRGWYVFPLRVGDKRPALHGETRCPGTGECAHGHRKFEQRATRDPARIHAAWTMRPFNIGIATGPSGLVVVDLDMPKAKDPKGTPSGVTTFAALCERAGQTVPATYRVRTASGGEHLYFTAPDGARLHNTKETLAPKVDTRAWGGYVVAPGSATPPGSYAVVDAAPVLPLPGWLRDALTPRQRPAGPLVLNVPRHGTRCAQVALDRERAAIEAAPEGKREETLFKAARAMGRFVAWGDIPRHEVEQAFQLSGESTGLPASQCRATLRSALNWAIRTCQPRRTA
ncbi:bifunctional DNA primase/polymerase [Streptomyces sp. NPDC058308]|uniref:bifunctional DNA primase/polymerase n=1 Tax=Streptomyces sp. NPDC058308 TaxID=3346440 RepID=UPI0036EB5D55